jgi:hypothetical protein
MFGKRGDEQAFDATRVAQMIGLDEQAAIQIEELEEAPMQGTEPVQRIARKTDLQDVLVAAREYVDKRASTAGKTRIGHYLFHNNTCVRSERSPPDDGGVNSLCDQRHHRKVR